MVFTWHSQNKLLLIFNKYANDIYRFKSCHFYILIIASGWLYNCVSQRNLLDWAKFSWRFPTSFVKVVLEFWPWLAEILFSFWSTYVTISWRQTSLFFGGCVWSCEKLVSTSLEKSPQKLRDSHCSVRHIRQYQPFLGGPFSTAEGRGMVIEATMIPYTVKIFSLRTEIVRLYRWYVIFIAKK